MGKRDNLIGILYIANNNDRGDLVKSFYPDADFRLVQTPLEAIGLLAKVSSLLFVFFDSEDLVQDEFWIVRLKEALPRECYFIVLHANISMEDRLGYASLGVNDILNPENDPDVLRERVAFLERHASAMRHQQVYDSGVFHYRISRRKRLFDLFFASLALIVLSPLFLLIAIAIRVESRGKAIYQSKRVGTGYRIFGFYKFRSMYIDADQRLKEFADRNQYVDETDLQQGFLQDHILTSDEAKFYSDHAVYTESEYLKERKAAEKKTFVKIQNDPRVTRVGRIIRKLSIDELPQLINVLKGEMSIVGNRPLPPYEAEMLTTDNYLERFWAPAGMTGLWQVEKRGRNSTMSPEERKQLDIYYARNYSVGMDMKIILKTIPAMIQREDV
jgi:Sugar transferases involved in lipopolysaccharide synthesis